MRIHLNTKTKPRQALSPIAIAVSTLLIAGASIAQDIPTLKTVVVTATKLDEPLLGSPNSVTVINAAEIEKNRIRTVEDITKFTPNLKLDNGYGAGSRGFLSIRGLGNTPGSIDPSASIYVDDIPYNDFTAYAQPLFDVKQVEVLKGSQGTLYGGFAQAGVIDIRSMLPGKETKRNASIELASPKNMRTTVSLSGAVNDVLSLGISALDERGESFIKNVTLDKRSERKQNSVRLQGVLRPDVGTEAVVTILHNSQRNDGGSDYLPVNRANYNSFAGVTTDKFEIANNIEGYQNLDTDAQSVRFKKLTQGLEYTIVAANRDTKSKSLVDFNYTPTNTGFLFASASDDKISNQYLETRARLMPASPSVLDLSVGASWMKQTYDVYNTVNLGTSTYDIIRSDGQNTSVFTHAKYPLNNAGLALIGGLRYEQAQRTGQNGPSDFRTGASVVAPTTVDSNQLTWKFGVSNVLASGADLYAHVATGWRPGGVNYYTDSFNTGSATYNKETSITYETGYRYANDSQYFSAALFLTRVSDYQETKYGVNPGAGYLSNVATVVIPGFELEAKQALGSGVSVFGGLGYTQAKFDKYPEFTALEGKSLGNRPDWNLNMGAEYKTGSMTYGATVVASDSFTSAYTTSGTTTKVDGYLVGNLRATYKDKGLSVSAFVDNVANTEYFLNAGYYNYGGFLSPQARGQVGAPRTMGINVKVDF